MRISKDRGEYLWGGFLVQDGAADGGYGPVLMIMLCGGFSPGVMSGAGC